MANNKLNQRKKILITGANGMFGWALTKNLSSKYKLIGTDIEDTDITDADQIKEEILQSRPQTIIHTAAYTNVDNSEIDKELAYKINVTGTENIARAAELCQARLIYISTDFVFDGKKKTPYKEDDTPNPLNYYGRTKLEGEQRVQAICPNHLIIRTAWLYGPQGKNFIDKILQLSAQQLEIKVVNDQTGSPTYTLDLASAIQTILKTNTTGILHITNSGRCTWFELAQKIIEFTSKKTVLVPITSQQLNLPAKRPAYSVLNTDKFQQITRMNLPSWQDSLRKYLTESNPQSRHRQRQKKTKGIMTNTSG